MVEDGGWIPDKESAVTDSAGGRIRRWIRHRQLLLSLLLIASLVVIMALVSGALIYAYYSPSRLRPQIPQKTCEKMYCMYGARCQVDHITQQAYCRCQKFCDELFLPVCGTDGVTYTSDCQLEMASCTQQTSIRIHHKGPCDTKDPCEEKECPFGSRCRPKLDGRTAECFCPNKCDTYGDSQGSRPVCGTDGRDYPNVCELKKTSCQEMREIHIKFQGRCDPCEGVECPTSQVCQLDDNRNPICRCNSGCSLDVRPVCGSDGKTYTNECTLRVEACRSRKSIRILYDGECSTGTNPCEGLDCGPGEQCDIDRYGIATCVCPPDCEHVMRPVCGSDGRTYHNHCEMMRHACVSRRDITLSYKGECGEKGPCHNQECSFGAVCVVKGTFAICECPSCTEEFEPVCGTDGISYTNHCKLRREGCEQRVHVQVAYAGLCNGCENIRCEFYSVCEGDNKKEARCVCPHSCVKVQSSVCGTDGVTYLNECEMRVAACNKQEYVVVGSRGPCDLCHNIHCKYGARCENGQCVCPTECPVELYEPVCAIDGSTHYNECEMRRTSCVQSKELTVLFYGECEDVGSSGQDSNSASVGCQEKKCHFGSTCEYDSDGQPVCVCRFECDQNPREPVCGSDNGIHENDCHLKEESCRQQQQLYILPMSMCEDYTDVPCDSEPPLVDALTGEDYFCGEGAGSKKCPPSSYCHKTATFAKCCRQIALIKTCVESTFGCCPDDKTAAMGPNFAGCPSVCNCNRLGSYGLTCDAETKQCSCKPGVGGLRCDRCEPGYWGLHKATEGSSGCSSCNCNLFGSVRDDCEQMTGRCVCKQGIRGMKCDNCPHGAVLGPSGCTDASISQPIMGSCSELVCFHGAICQQKDDGGLTAQCVCDFQCSGDRGLENDSVCGTDSNTYGSECQMRLFACRYQKSIVMANEGPCKRRGEIESAQIDGQMPTPGSVRRSTIQRISPADVNKSTRDLVQLPYQVTESPTVATPDEDTYVDIKVPSFSGRSYLELPRLQAYSRLSLEVVFRSFSKNGIILYNGQSSTGVGDFVALTLKDGFVEFRYDLGNGPVVLRSLQKLHMGKLHRIVARRYHRDGFLTLDGQTDVSGRSRGSLKSLDLAENLFLGYVPSETEKIFENLSVKTGMVGCISQLKIGKKDVDLSLPTSKDIIRGSAISECEGNVCSSNPCRNDGICVSSDGDESSCNCVAGFSGEFCEDQAEDPCWNKPCPRGTTCRNNKHAHFHCDYPSEVVDSYRRNEFPRQDAVFVPDFDGQSYLEFPTLPSAKRSLSIEMWFLSRSTEGVLLYNGQNKNGDGDFVSITIRNGRVVYGFDIGSTTPSSPGVLTIQSLERISLNQWHSVKVNRSGKTGTLQVNDGIALTGETATSLTELNLDASLYVGGVPDLDLVRREANVEIGLNGALQKMVVNGELWDDLLSSATWSHRVKRYRGPPCGGPTIGKTSDVCLNGGVCLPKLNNFTCQCPLQFWGPRCEHRFSKRDLERPIALDGTTSLKFQSDVIPAAEGQRENNIEITFRTKRYSGLLMCTHDAELRSTHQGDYLALAIEEGQVLLSFNLGKEVSQKPLLVESKLIIADFEWHTIIVERNSRVGNLFVDGEFLASVTSTEGATQLNTGGTYWIGGCPNVPADLPDGFYANFEGCIKNIIVDGVPLHLIRQNGNNKKIQFCDDS